MGARGKRERTRHMVSTKDEQTGTVKQPPGPSAEILRRRIDAGETGDKIGVADPAAAPLGTDDEAAGTPPTPARVRTALDQETRLGDEAGPEPGRGRVAPHEPTDRRSAAPGACSSWSSSFSWRRQRFCSCGSAAQAASRTSARLVAAWTILML